ncbi:hypothetical protein METBIDRAFT_30695 [Metschnikowia bicuspidata var. bicuspidata NRRL YB-4993]|uniref:Uncharacterized protein n=1 Tax=Metschnikowia bicuspidata var. bicuspidata NRRL YB-4993 TaxID=869754 RepID=A0A1A0HK87_9ASCO|nr:hypothetical protein METBIDRAFT_30695 [Metschnikowia bicuspidata var. bicuspidata NRRL YB-4993]OBA24416.1 hypothetical protein METBIDRAFT_30695 [Metschnikowia bicuspidata var. bicuspidata NRRL YB-4993]
MYQNRDCSSLLSSVIPLSYTSPRCPTSGLPGGHIEILDFRCQVKSPAGLGL